MKELNLTVFEPGDMLGTMSKDGKVAVFTVSPLGDLVPSDNRMFASGLNLEDPIEALNLTVRTYNVLKREQVNTIGEMVAIYDEKGRDGFINFRNMGEKCIDEIVEHINRLRGEDT
jgi:DNA-directed RNA polymerase subunit alpha